MSPHYWLPGGDTIFTPGLESSLLVPNTEPALYCSCGVVRAPDSHRGEPDLDRKSDDDDVTPPSGVGDELAGSGGDTGLVMQNTIRLMLPAGESRTDGRRLIKPWRKQHHHVQPPTRINAVDLFDDINLLRPVTSH